MQAETISALVCHIMTSDLPGIALHIGGGCGHYLAIRFEAPRLHVIHYKSQDAS